MQDAEPATRVLAATPEAVEEGASLLRRGSLVAFPTDTVYGVGAYAYNERGVERLYEAKLRSRGKAIPLLISSADEIACVAIDIPDLAWRLAQVFLPGGLTMVLRKSPQIPDFVTAGADTVAVRVPDYPITLSLIERVGAPLAVTSANLSGRPSPVTADEVYAQLAGRIELILDGGPCPGGRESSVLDLTGPAPTLLRAGAISKADLERVCGKIEG